MKNEDIADNLISLTVCDEVEVVQSTSIDKTVGLNATKASLSRKLMCMQANVLRLSGNYLNCVRENASEECLMNIEEECYSLLEEGVQLNIEILDTAIEGLDVRSQKIESEIYKIRDCCIEARKSRQVGLAAERPSQSQRASESEQSSGNCLSPIPLKKFACEAKQVFNPPSKHVSEDILNRPINVASSYSESQYQAIRNTTAANANNDPAKSPQRAALNPEAAAFHQSNVSMPVTHGFAADPQHAAWSRPSPCYQQLPPAPQLVLENFDGDIMTYWNFKRSFKRHVEDVYLKYEDRMAFLEGMCVGKAKEVIAGLSCLVSSENAYKKAWERLEKRFGDSKKLMNRLKQELLEGPPLKDGDAEGLIKLSDKMFKCEVSFEGWNKSSMLNSQEIMYGLFERLPYKIKAQFVGLSNEGGSEFKDLRSLIERAASDAESEYGVLLHKTKDVRSSQGRLRIQKNPTNKRVCMAQYSGNLHPANKEQKRTCIFCQDLHPIWKCMKFRALTTNDRRLYASDKSLCFNCLIPGHRVAQCKVTIRCSKCNKKHNTLLHVEFEKYHKGSTSGSLAEESNETGVEVGNPEVCASNNIERRQNVNPSIFKVVPVEVCGEDPHKCICTYAFIDEGSNVNLCSSSLAERLGISMAATNVKLMTSNAVSVLTHKVDNLIVRGVNEPESFSIKEALVVDQVVDVSDSIPTDKMVERYPHLQDLCFPNLKEKKIDLLLGCDLHQAFLAKEILLGEPGTPSGLHTGLGWTIFGKADGDQRLHESPKLLVNFLKAGDDDDHFCEQLLKVLAQDFDDCNEAACIPALSQEDKRALFILNNTLKQEENGHYSVGLLWKDDCAFSGNSYALAERRLMNLKRRFLKDPDLFSKYSDKMTEYINCFAEHVPPESSTALRCSYIPHHCISSSNKFRIVFDCSARCDGSSLNDRLLQGPDLTNSVVGVLLRFRQYPVAVVGDIRGMFSQVLVDEQDRDALRFLWFENNDLHQPVVTYRMRTHVFGAKCSPCCAAFALRMVASDNTTNADPDTVQAVLKNIYVDDLCVSCPIESGAIRLITQLQKLLVSGGFKLTKFLSNSRTVMEHLPDEDLVGGVRPSGLPVHKTLGVFWDVGSDRFKVQVRIKPKPCTRRGLLSMIGQTYDPLGFLQPFLLPARQLLQQACAANLGWDDRIDCVAGLENGWEDWFASLPELERVELNRCVFSERTPSRVELHIFADASTVGYGACAYLRVLFCDGNVMCNLVFGKSRVAPLKKVSVPRLELAAAVLAAKMAKLILREIEIDVNQTFYWTDATVVLRYLYNSSSRFDVFVSNRVELLHTLTSLEQWRYVPTCDNPADLASRGISPRKCTDVNTWFYGPPFLMTENDWPKQPHFITDPAYDDADVKLLPRRCAGQVAEEEDKFHQMFARYSDFTRLQRAVAWLFRFQQYMRWKLLKDVERPPVGPLTAAEVRAALQVVLKITQAHAFADVIRILPNQSEQVNPLATITEHMLKQSPALRKLQALSPFVVNSELRVGGRLQNASLPYETKYPLLLPQRHPVTDLLIRYCHEKEGHLGANHVLAEINKNYWIIHGRATVRRVLDGCASCRLWKAETGRQQMGVLPPTRVKKTLPFTAVGTDLMGPIMVTIGRSRVQRYVCLFNCMATRAVHLEVVPSQDADAFLQAYRRFCNRRNVSPETICSDNGGNFVAAEKYLRGQVNWQFNPPRASHQGGFYEIFFKLFRKVFRSIATSCTLSEFDFLTYVVEIERILNNRPITKIPNSPDDWAALSPNAILTGSLADDAPPGKFLKADAYRQCWKKTQYLADRFWHQWTGQYLPLLQPKQKWFGACRNLKPGDLVLVSDEASPRGQWPKAVVVEIILDKRKLVRRVRVRLADGSVLMRDIRKLCLLEGQVDD